MRKAITPIIATVLLILMTVVSVGASFFWVTSVSTSIEESAGGTIESAGSSGCSMINLISVRGDKVVVQNNGCDDVTKVSLLVDGILTEYTLNTPLSPGDARSITLSETLSAGEAHTIKVITQSGVSSTETISEGEATNEAGFSSGNITGRWFAGCPASSPIVNFDNTFNFGGNIGCGCDSISTTLNDFNNPGFESGFAGWSITNDSSSNKNIELSSFTTHTGSNSLMVLNLNDSLDNLPFASQTVSNTDYFRFWVYGNTSSVSDSFGLIQVLFNRTDSGDVGMYYTAFQNFTGSAMGLTCDMNMGGAFIHCITGLVENEWNEVVLHPVSDMMTYLSYDASVFNNISVNLGAGISTRIYYDDTFVNLTSEGYLCDSMNNDGVADGVCNDGICVPQPYDINQDFCELADYTWFSGTITGSNGSCCGDDGINDIFINNTAGCCSSNDYYTCVDNSIGEKFCACSGSSYIDSCGDEICQSWENATTCTYDCSWSEPIYILTHGYSPKLILAANNTLYASFFSNMGTEKIGYINSSDNGLTWENKTLPITTSSMVGPIIIAGNGENIHYAWADDKLRGGLPGCMSDVFYVNSSNAGLTWNTEANLTYQSDCQAMKQFYTYNNYIHLFYAGPLYSGVKYFRSTDGGITWENSIYLSDLSYGSYSIVNTSYLYTVVYNSTAFGLIKSEDNGETWSENITIISDLLNINTFYMSYTNTELYLIWSNGTGDYRNVYLSKSNDNGISWTSPSLVISNEYTSSIILSRENNVYIIYTVKSGSDIQLYSVNSDDAGSSWYSPTRIGNFNVINSFSAVFDNDRIHLLVNNYNYNPDPAQIFYTRKLI